ncbi:MAG: ABC transporter ATP-binding protein [Sumerlaeia bacterium]
MIQAHALTKIYGQTRCLEGVTFDVPEGEILGFLGPNGAGKTTTMRILTGQCRPTQGTAAIGGHDVVRDSLAVRELLGYLPEEAPLYPEMTVQSYLRFMAGMKHIPAKSVKREVDKALREVNLDKKANRLIQNLSKGQRQRVGLAQALLGDPKVLILDEPTVGLDPSQISEIRQLIAAMKGQRTVILSTHILPEVAMTCTRVAVLDRGRIAAQGTFDEVAGSAGGRTITVAFRGSGKRGKDVLEPLIQNELLKIKDSTTTDGISHLRLAPVEDAEEMRPAIARAFVEGGVDLLELSETTPSLEDVFLKLTSREASLGS